MLFTKKFAVCQQLRSCLEAKTSLNNFSLYFKDFRHISKKDAFFMWTFGSPSMLLRIIQRAKASLSVPSGRIRAAFLKNSQKTHFFLIPFFNRQSRITKGI
jgi:hypothetical protein